MSTVTSVSTKQCRTCGAVLPLTEFYRASGSADGFERRCKDCCRRRTQAYYREHAEARQEYARNRYAADPDKAIESVKKWQAENRDKVIAYRDSTRQQRRSYKRAYMARHKNDEIGMKLREGVNRRTRRWRARHADRARMQVQQSRRRNPMVVIAAKQRRRARILGSEGTVTAADWRAIKERYGYVCLACGKQTRLTMDHIAPLSRGGRHDPSNIQPLCMPCNHRKGTRTIDYRPDVLQGVG